MDSQQFTPGPWQIERARNDSYGPIFRIIGNTPDKWNGKDGTIGSLHMNDSFGCDWTFPKDKDGELTYDENGLVICYNRTDLPAEANARLIAAAPEMYELLKGFADLGAEDVRKFLEKIVNPVEEIKVCKESDYQIY